MIPAVLMLKPSARSTSTAKAMMAPIAITTMLVPILMVSSWMWCAQHVCAIAAHVPTLATAKPAVTAG